MDSLADAITSITEWLADQFPVVLGVLGVLLLISLADRHRRTRARRRPRRGP